MVAMTYSIKENLLGNEELVMEPHVHWFIVAPGVAITIVSLLFMPMDRLKSLWDWTMYYGLSDLFGTLDTIVINDWYLVACVFFLLVGIGETARGILRKQSLSMGITNQRIVKNYGMFTTSTDEIYLNNVSSVEIEQSFWGKTFNFGYVYFESPFYGTIIFPMVKNPMVVRQAALYATQGYSASGT